VAGYNQYLWAATGVDGNPGLTRVNLGQQVGTNLVFAYAWDLYDPTTTGFITTSCSFAGNTDRLVFCTANNGVANGKNYIETATRLTPTGTMRTAFVRYNTLENKIFKFLQPRYESINGSLAIYSDTAATISDTGTACTNANTTVGAFLCPVTGVVAGTAKVKVYASAQTVMSNEISLTVSQATAATVKLSWNKASYAPGEKATLIVDVYDSKGKDVPNGTFANLFATGGISLSSAAGNGSDTLTAVSITTSTPAQNYTGTSTDGQFLYTVYMPSSGATITASATGGTSLPAAGQVKVSASATVTDSGAAALAAVTALATTVASLKTLITTLTNLVLKIQKKVKA
jgi:hypothetical protein